MRRPRIRTQHVVAFAAAAALGAVTALVMPEHWSNLESTPGFMAWLIAPAFLAFVTLCAVTLTDFVSNDGANPIWLDTLWVVSIALVMGIYGLLAAAVVTWVKRVRGRRSHATSTASTSPVSYPAQDEDGRA